MQNVKNVKTMNSQYGLYQQKIRQSPGSQESSVVILNITRKIKETMIFGDRYVSIIKHSKNPMSYMYACKHCSTERWAREENRLRNAVGNRI